MDSAAEPDPKTWERVSNNSDRTGYQCLVCNDLRVREAHRTVAHEKTEVHQAALQHRNGMVVAPGEHFENPDNLPLSAFVADGGVAQIAQQLSKYLDMDPVSEDEAEERSEDEAAEEDPQEPTVTDPPVDNGDEDSDHARKRPRNRDHTEYSCQWFPWSDKITCTLDVLMHLPRSVFSHGQLELFIWLLKVNNVDNVPSVKSMQELNLMLQKLCGIESIAYNGALGHKYYEMSNPQVRPYLHFYPEYSGSLLEEARQGKRWLEEIPSTQTTPMARIGPASYFIHEPAMLADGQFCMPFRYIRSDFQRYKVPDPSKIKDILDPITGIIVEWDLTDPAVGNPWRERAEGSRVYSFPLWLYCDDTSGNLSKKWNEHNSFLFTPAGLPREQSQKEFNIHFLSTSNIAPPLEMLDGILDQLEAAQKDGVWAWDCVLNELVLIIPTVLALLGDNPMQSEFACHIGLHGKYFCRACWVKGNDRSDEEAEDPAPSHRQNTGAASDAGSPAAADDADRPAAAGDTEVHLPAGDAESQPIGDAPPFYRSSWMWV
ncbi:hypothetical protein B0H13DRAFT_1909984 [Mycena leptocephala]|nr:hypothetical protein B0H13DRAFT_1909984 [Mycena leptocephala]